MRRKRDAFAKDWVIKIFKNTLKSRFKGQLKNILLFGSRARGDHSPESDYDFILVFKKVTKAVKRYLSKLGGDLLLKYGAVITEIPLSENDLRKMKYEPFIMNAYKEGISL